ncbi:DUF1232 domain-containing protein [bacterium]|nr:DUF1232 domain-containing protein [bacterium]
MEKNIIEIMINDSMPEFNHMLKTAVEFVRSDELSYESRATVMGGLLYFIAPEDIIPDAYAGIGLVDDFLILIFSIDVIMGIEKQKVTDLGLRINSSIFRKILSDIGMLKSSEPGFSERLLKFTKVIKNFVYKENTAAQYLNMANEDLEDLLSVITREADRVRISIKDGNKAGRLSGDVLCFVESKLSNLMKCIID